VSAFISVGVDGAGNVYPATLTAFPATAASGAGANLTIDTQAAVTGAAGSLVVNVPAPASGIVEAGIVVERAGTQIFQLAAVSGYPTYGVLSLGSGSPSATSVNGNGTLMNINFPSSGGSCTLVGGAVNVWVGTTSNFALYQPLNGASATPFVFGNSAVTLGTSGTTSITAAQQGTPNLTIAAVTLTGAAVLDFGNIKGNYQVNILGVNAGSFASYGLSLKNGTTTTALPSTALSNGGLVVVRCDTNAIAFCA
jgi:hypothetical protein